MRPSSMNRRLGQLKPAGKIPPDRAEEEIADRMADRLDVLARASVRVGGEVAVDVDRYSLRSPAVGCR